MNETAITKQLEQKQLNITREFNAPREMVWRTWTESELLDQWWAPRPWQAQTKYMDFREGGYWLYSMNGPEGERHWARADFKKIVPQQSFQAVDSFCDHKLKTE